jgi:hypothetical protein
MAAPAASLRRSVARCRCCSTPDDVSRACIEGSGDSSRQTYAVVRRAAAIRRTDLERRQTSVPGQSRAFVLKRFALLDVSHLENTRFHYVPH